MPKLIIQRNSEWNNKAREIGIYSNSKKLGTIKDGMTKHFELEAGTHDIYAKIDWCRSPKLNLKIEEHNTRILKLSGFKYGKWLMPVMLSFIALSILATYVLGMRWNYFVFIPGIVLVYLGYFITFGRKRYLRLTE
ncbi:hypothetical protein [Psychroflexus montanilacus]|uniref:hypothetical protein n=1 Tax=Psychroflexus montanilacus TaxID=2873598 RepID=UPI001CCE3B0A|nr:hypothetical protein [Psychroflexus montanilacus]MBZ9652240.1 hypothetical protein [Psychroflexus montanilacus]